MGTSKSPAELGAKLANAALGVQTAAKAGVAKAALLVKLSVQQELHGVTRLRGVGRKGAKIGVRYDVVGATGHATAIVRMTGPAHLIERDTSAHDIGPRGAHQAVRLADGSVRRQVHHPGTKGQHPFEKGVDRATPIVPRTMLVEQAAALRKAFT